LAESVLSSGELTRGRRLVRRFATLNGISVALLMDSVLILYAIRNGVGDSAVAVLASFIHLTMPLVVVGKALIARIGAARTWGLGWFLRNVSALLMIAAPWLPPHTPQPARTALILVGGFGFAAFRAIGLVGNSPIIGEVTSEGDRGRFLSGNWTRATSSQLVALVAMIVLLRVADEMWMFQMVIAIGAALGMYVGALLATVPESQVPRLSARKPLKEVLFRVWHIRRMRRLLFAWAASFAAFTLIVPFATITIKNGYGLSDYQALTFTLLTLAGGITASVVNGVVADRVGPRPLLVIYVAMLAGIALYWAAAPDRLLLVPTGIVYFLAGYAKFGILAASNHYFLNIADGSDRVGSSMVLRAISGAVAGLVGSVIGGGILAILNGMGLEGLSIYRTYFRIAIVALLAIIPVVRALDRLDEWPVRRVVVLLIQPHRILRMWRAARRVSSSRVRREGNSR
jgi:MFS family permease